MQQGKKLHIGNSNAFLNTFTHDEMLCIYFSLHTNREISHDFLNQYPACKVLTPIDFEEIDNVNHNLKNVSSAMIKIETTFKAMGIDLNFD